MPLCRPALAALGTLEVIWVYNEFFWPLLLITSGDRLPITTAINNLQGQFLEQLQPDRRRRDDHAHPDAGHLLRAATSVRRRTDARRHQGLTRWARVTAVGSAAMRSARRDGQSSAAERGIRARRRPTRTAATAASTPSSSSSAITQPPKPPPVIRAPYAPAPTQRVGGDVELRDGDAVVVAHRRVRLGEHRTDVADAAGTQQLDRLQHPIVLGDDVAHVAPQLVVGQPRRARRRGRRC